MRTATAAKTSLKKWIHVFSNLHRDYFKSLTLSNGLELFWSWTTKNLIQVQKEKENFIFACLGPPGNLKLGGNFRTGGGWPLESFFRGAPSKIDEKTISYFTVNRCFKAKIIVFIDDLSFAVGWVLFHGLLMNKLPVIYLVFNVMWSCSNKPSSNMFLTEVIEVHWFERWHHLCRVRPYRLHGSQWLTVNS